MFLFMLKTRFISLSALVVAQLFLAGCATSPKPTPGEARYSPVIPLTQPVSPSAQGSIYASGAGISLWEDKRARRVCGLRRATTLVFGVPHEGM